MKAVDCNRVPTLNENIRELKDWIVKVGVIATRQNNKSTYVICANVASGAAIIKRLYLR
jgi:hypothetical protein